VVALNLPSGWAVSERNYSPTTSKQLTTKFGRAVGHNYTRVADTLIDDLINGLACPLRRAALEAA
jgi:hypothetical protein